MKYLVFIYTYDSSSMKFSLLNKKRFSSENPKCSQLQVYEKNNEKYLKISGDMLEGALYESPIKNLRVNPLTSSLLFCLRIDLDENVFGENKTSRMDLDDKEFTIDMRRSFCVEFQNNEILNDFLNLHYNPVLHQSSCHIKHMSKAVVQAYFQYYGKMSNQMNMLQDYVRTSVYQNSMIKNESDFKGKHVMDVGAGSGILSFFAIQAGSAFVYAIEASCMAEVIKIILEGNKEYARKVKVINKILEDITEDDLDYKTVDVLVSEPIGIFLFNERMIETFLTARDKFLKPGGRMYPNRCAISIAPFTDSALYADFCARANFWSQTNFYGVDLSNAYKKAVDEQFRQPIVDYVDPNTLIASPHVEDFNFETIKKEDLANIDFSFEFLISHACLIHGLAGWFEVFFDGSDEKIGFSTSPFSTSTHWYQIRFLMKTPLAVNAGQTVKGNLKMVANNQQSYYINIKMNILGTNIYTESTTIDLKDQDYRYYTHPTSSYLSNYYSVANQFYPSSCFSSNSLQMSNNQSASGFFSSSYCRGFMQNNAAELNHTQDNKNNKNNKNM